MKLSEVTGFSTDVIHGAYNEVMDYLVFGGEFGTGESIGDRYFAVKRCQQGRNMIV